MVFTSARALAGQSLGGARAAPAARTRAAVPSRQVTCMAKKGKQTRVIITLECTEQKGSGTPGMSRYNTTKVSPCFPLWPCEERHKPTPTPPRAPLASSSSCSLFGTRQRAPKSSD